jgi:predicted nucleic acid-binding protein
VTAIVLDTGALIGLERNDRGLWALLKLSATSSDDVIVPATVLAQAWRGARSQAQLGRALDFCEIASFDDVARAVGELCGRAGTSDICDAHVAIVAASRETTLYTSDPDDMRKLIAVLGRRRPAIIRC